MSRVEDLFTNHSDVQSVLEGLDQQLREQLVAGLSGSARSLLIAGLYRETGRPVLVVTHNLLQAQKLQEDLRSFLSAEEIYLFPANEMVAAELSIASPELRAERLETLNHFAQSGEGIVIVPLAGLKKILPAKTVWLAYQLTFLLGAEVDLQSLPKKLVAMGYVRSHMVDTPGEFSVRGGIFDIYPLTEEHPIRIEFFDTEVDSIRTFDVETQRSLENLNTVTIGPATEAVIGEDELKALAEKLQMLLPQSLAKLKVAQAKQHLSQQIESLIEILAHGGKPDQLARFLSLAYEEPASLLDYFPGNGFVVFDEMSRIHELNEQMERDDFDYFTTLLADGAILHDCQLTHSLTDLLNHRKHPSIYLSLFIRHVPGTSPQNIVNFSCKPMQSFHGQMNLFKAEAERWEKAGYTVLLQGSDRERIKKLSSVLEDFRLDFLVNQNVEQLVEGKLQIVSGQLQSGFELPMQKLVVVTEQELFNQRVRKRFSQQKISNAERIRSYSELERGDYVVHINHGIGKYLGIETLVIDGIHKDFLHIQYQGTDKLYVPVDQIDSVQKYVGSEGKEPKTYRLGGSDWKKTKAKVNASVQDIADELIKLYAEREMAKGFAFSADDDLQHAFEASFAYQETDDQLRSIEEIKKDMMRSRPMDRLLCGDVGYGKTEVAIRAAFKVINDDKQVAFLVPTTILAQQHYETLRERFQDYPIQVGLMSRFRTKKQQAETIKGLRAGTIDIVVGTHRILSKDVSFRDLGLLIVDEEQRFGVKHKERIKQLKTNVDVLTLTATPIPRTLHMSMLGVRDLSVIETPPENRFPIQTYVMEYNGSLVREAIERELGRGGQVFILHNRVDDISRRAAEVSSLVPDARVAYAHGQMSETELESVIYSFLNGEYDVLVSTTIIETGMDIPNANTLIVDNADRMGLSQLYQLRGRVGRSNRIAYAYFTYRKDKVLSEVAEKRLQAIKEFTELGSGFKIAMRDLSIRGAGNLLGAQQHGFIDSVGFDMYSKMLSDAIEVRRGITKNEEEQTIEISLEVDAYIPDRYILNSNQKIEIYKLFRSLSSMEDLEDLKDELIDRFGDYPEEVELLLLISELKIIGQAAQLESVTQTKKEEVTIVISEAMTNQIDGAKVFEVIQPFGRAVNLSLTSNQLKVILQIKSLPPKQWLGLAIQLVQHLPRCLKQDLVPK